MESPASVSTKPIRKWAFASQIAGSVDVDTSVIDRKIRRFMGPSAMYSFLSMEQAIAQAGLTEELISNDPHRPDRGLRRRVLFQPG